MSDLMICVL